LRSEKCRGGGQKEGDQSRNCRKAVRGTAMHDSHSRVSGRAVFFLAA
jgi:hypothetical protein